MPELHRVEPATNFNTKLAERHGLIHHTEQQRYPMGGTHAGTESK